MNKLIIYNTPDGESAIALFAKDGSVWLNQNQLAELFGTSVPNISMHISNILKEGELSLNSVVKDYLTTASDGKDYNVAFYSLEMIMAIGFRVRTPPPALLSRGFNGKSHTIQSYRSSVGEGFESFCCN